MKDIIIGIDGGSFNFLYEMINKDKLNNFKELINNGYHSVIEATIPPITIPSWPCLFSGLSPEDLDFYFFYHPKNGLFNSSYWKNNSIFSLPNLKFFIMNVPGTYPAWKINGEMITGMLSPKISTYPKELSFSIKKNWIIDGKNPKSIFKGFELKKKKFLNKLKEDFDIMVYVIRMPDGLSHHTGINVEDTFKNIYFSYIKIDNFIGKLMKHPEVRNLIILSDHGLNYYKKLINISTLLRKKNLIEYHYDYKKVFSDLLFYCLSYINPLININSILDKINSRKVIKKIKLKQINTNEFKIKGYDSNVGGLFLYGKGRKKKNLIKIELEKQDFIKKVIIPNKQNFPDLFIILKKEYYFDDRVSLFIKRRTEVICHSQRGIFIAYGPSFKKGNDKIINYRKIAPTILKMRDLEKKPYMIDFLNIFKENI